MARRRAEVGFRRTWEAQGDLPPRRTIASEAAPPNSSHTPEPAPLADAKAPDAPVANPPDEGPPEGGVEGAVGAGAGIVGAPCIGEGWDDAGEPRSTRNGSTCKVSAW